MNIQKLLKFGASMHLMTNEPRWLKLILKPFLS